MIKVKIKDFLKDYKKYITVKEKKDADRYYFDAKNVKDFNAYFCNSCGTLEKITGILYSWDWNIFTEKESYVGGDFDFLYKKDDYSDIDIAERISIYLDIFNCSILSGVYFIGSSNLNCIKIGFSRNVENRLKQLQTSHPEKLKIYGVVNGRKEKELHKQFANLRKQGEWFAKTQNLKHYILSIHYPDVNPVIAQILKDRKELNQ